MSLQTPSNYDATGLPLRYQSTFEKQEPDENETTNEIVETMCKIQTKVAEDLGRGMRSVHAKAHGILRGELRVLEDLPLCLAQGIFATADTYPVVIRLSTAPGDVLADSVSTPRGMAIKVVNVPGQRLPGSEGQKTQDFVLANSPAFHKPNAKAFLGGLKLLAATTNKAEGLKKAASALLRGTEKVVEALGGKSATLISMGGHPETHPLGETYFSQVPLLHGEYMAKVSVVPVSPELAALTDAPLDVNDKPDGLRSAVVDFFRVHGGEWELRVQLCTDIEAMPIEDASAEWSEELSAYVPVARISVMPQQAWRDVDSTAVDQQLAFSPWHGIEAHRPLGSVMRVRKASYEASARFRAERNKVSLEEPQSLHQLPGQ